MWDKQSSHLHTLIHRKEKSSSGLNFFLGLLSTSGCKQPQTNGLIPNEESVKMIYVLTKESPPKIQEINYILIYKNWSMITSYGYEKENKTRISYSGNHCHNLLFKTVKNTKYLYCKTVKKSNSVFTHINYILKSLLQCISNTDYH